MMRQSAFWSGAVLCIMCILAFGVACYAQDGTGEVPGQPEIVSPALLAQGNTGDSGISNEGKKRIRGKVFRYKYGGINERIECDNYRIYLVKDGEPGAQGELILDAKQASFDFTLSEKQLQEYTLLEFTSSYDNKTINIRDVQDAPLEVVLEPEVVLKKPAIYLYPEQRTQISVTHSFKGRILNTYPAYNGNWTVIAEPNGDLLNLGDKRSYKYLFWDGVYAFSPEHYQYKSGFYVKSGDYVSFLQSKLALIGLNQNEINDFIVYWLPALNNYRNCFIYFRVNDNIDGTSVLTTTPAADTTIRVFMEFSRADDIGERAKLPEQVLPTLQRKGFTLVEWGGAEIGKAKIE